jgi:hypothetical protein
MDGDPSQEDRIRLIGRLFFFTCARRLILRSFVYAKVFIIGDDHSLKGTKAHAYLQFNR